MQSHLTTAPTAETKFKLLVPLRGGCRHPDPPLSEKIVHRYQCANTNVKTLSLLEKAVCSWGKPKTMQPKRFEKGVHHPVVMPYHPCIFGLVERTIRCVPPPPEIVFKVIPAFRNAVPSLASIVRRHNHKVAISHARAEAVVR